MAANKLTEGERERLLSMIAEGEEQASIAETFSISVQNVHYYASAYRDRIQEMARARGDLALSAGLAIRGNRVDRLQALARELERKLGGADFGHAHGSNLPVVREWRETLKQIRDELKDIEPDKPQQLNVSGDIEVRRTIVHKTG